MNVYFTVLVFHPSTKTECDYLNGWIKKKKQKNAVKYAKYSPTMVNARDIVGERRRRRMVNPSRRRRV